MQDPKKTLGIKLPFLVMIIKNLKKYFTFEVQVWKSNIWLLSEITFNYFRYLMIKMFGGDFGLQIISQLRELNHLSVQCQCD